MRARPGQRPAFTIVELLVVIGIISALVALLLPALSGVQKRSRKTTELSHLKQVAYAWNVYANSNNDGVLPGYLEADVQAPPEWNVSRGWGVKFEYPDGTNIPTSPDNITGSWPWRLASYLDYSHNVLHGYTGEDDDLNEMVAEAVEIADEPAFGYNGYYMGGWWEMQDLDGIQTPRQKFYDHCDATPPTPDNPLNPDDRLTIPISVSQIRKSAEMVSFCSSTKLSPNGAYYGKMPADTAGAHLVAGPWVATTQQWDAFNSPAGPIGGDAIAVLADDAFVPFGRHTGAPAVLYGDGHTDTQAYNALFDQRKWINDATTRGFQHGVCP